MNQVEKARKTAKLLINNAYKQEEIKRKISSFVNKTKKTHAVYVLYQNDVYISIYLNKEDKIPYQTNLFIEEIDEILQLDKLTPFSSDETGRKGADGNYCGMPVYIRIDMANVSDCKVEYYTQTITKSRKICD